MIFLYNFTEQAPSVFDLKRGNNPTGATVPRGFRSVMAPVKYYLSKFFKWQGPNAVCHYASFILVVVVSSTIAIGQGRGHSNNTIVIIIIIV